MPVTEDATEAPRVATPLLREPASVLELYREALRKRGFAPDDSQYAAVLRLQNLYEAWTDYKRRRRTALHRLVVRHRRKIASGEQYHCGGGYAGIFQGQEFDGRLAVRMPVCLCCSNTRTCSRGTRWS